MGFDSRDGWKGWDSVEAQMPLSEMSDLIIDLRSLTQGVGTYEMTFDHLAELTGDRKSTRLNSSHQIISYAVFCLKKKKQPPRHGEIGPYPRPAADPWSSDPHRSAPATWDPSPVGQQAFRVFRMPC